MSIRAYMLAENYEVIKIPDGATYKIKQRLGCLPVIYLKFKVPRLTQTIIEERFLEIVKRDCNDMATVVQPGRLVRRNRRG